MRYENLTEVDSAVLKIAVERSKVSPLFFMNNLEVGRALGGGVVSLTVGKSLVRLCKSGELIPVGEGYRLGEVGVVATEGARLSL